MIAKIVFWAVLGLLFLFLIITIIRCKLCNRKLKDVFKDHSIIVFGAKGKGKDLLFQKVIYIRRLKYLSNMDYGYGYTHCKLKDLTVEPNTYEQMINNKITPVIKNNDYEGQDYYLSDAGIYLPAQYDFLLHKKYKSLPIFYATSRHLYNMNMHLNTQNLERVWKAIREQADYYILCRKKIKLLFGFICFIRFYDKYQTALDRLEPLGGRIFNKFSKAEVDLYNAKNGEIKNGIYYLRKKDIKYDTRYFHKIFFNQPAPIKPDVQKYVHPKKNKPNKKK